MIKTLRSKIFLFVSMLLLLPALPLSILIMQLLDKSYQIGVNKRVESALDEGLKISTIFYQIKKNRLQSIINQISSQHNVALDEIYLLLKNEFEGSQINIIQVEDNNFINSIIGPKIVEKFINGKNKNLIWPSADRMTLYALARIDKNELLEITYAFPNSFQNSASNIQEVSQIYKTLGMVNKEIRNSFLYTFLFIYGLGIFLALIVSFLISKIITRPIETLTQATKEIASGNLDYRIELKGQDEFKSLAKAFNLMTEELANTQRRIIELEKMATWQQMARRLAHEIKNPLTPIQLMAQQIVDKYPGSDRFYKDMLKESYEIIEQEVESLKKLVRAFSDFARLPDFQPAKHDLRQLLLSLSKLYQQAEIILDLPPGEYEFNFDYDYIKRALVNLVDNAVTASSPNGSVQVAINEERDFIEILVSDQGPGIPIENIDKIFEPYFSTKQTGVGLGLAIVKKIVEEHGGKIFVKTSSEKGTTFSILLPKSPKI